MVTKINLVEQPLVIELLKLTKEVNTLMLVPGPGSSGPLIKQADGNSTNEQ